MTISVPAQNFPPPDLPAMAVEPLLTSYLRRFSAWANSQLAGKIPLNTAIDGVLLRAFDAPAGVTPLTYKLQVHQDGTLSTVQISQSGAAGTAIDFAPVVAYNQVPTSDPAATPSTTYVMMGLALTTAPVRLASAAWVTVSGQISNSANNGQTNVVICYGRGTPPAWGVAQTGTIASAPARYISTAANDYVPFSLTALVQGLVEDATDYWFDVAVSASGGSGKIAGIEFSVHGLA